MIEYIPPESPVVISTGSAGDSFRGTVATVSITTGRVQYEVIWWHEGVRYCEWLEEFEVDAAEEGDR